MGMAESFLRSHQRQLKSLIIFFVSLRQYSARVQEFCRTRISQLFVKGKTIGMRSELPLSVHETLMICDMRQQAHQARISCNVFIFGCSLHVCLWVKHYSVFCLRFSINFFSPSPQIYCIHLIRWHSSTNDSRVTQRIHFLRFRNHLFVYVCQHPSSTRTKRKLSTRYVCRAITWIQTIFVAINAHFVRLNII